MKEYYEHLCACNCGGKIEIKPWHKYKSQDIPEYINGHNGRGKPIWNKGLTAKTDDRVRKQGNGSYGKYGPLSHSWKGGCNDYWHAKARELFGKAHCEKCGISSEEQIELYKYRLSMHCTSIPKDYTIMEPDNWQTFCNSCHQKIEKTND